MKKKKSVFGVVGLLVIVLIFYLRNDYQFQKKLSVWRGEIWLILNQNLMNRYSIVVNFTKLCKLGDGFLNPFFCLMAENSSQRLTSSYNLDKLSCSSSVEIAGDPREDWLSKIESFIQCQCFSKGKVSLSELSLLINELRNLRPSTQLVGTYLISSIAPSFKQEYQKTVSRITEICSKRTRFTDEIERVYACTHIAFVESDYYSRYLKPTDYAEVLDALSRKADELAIKQQGFSVAEADMVAEIIIALRLFNQTPPVILEKKIMTIQNLNGSWGEKNDSVSRKIHTTLVTILALMNWRDEPLKTPIYCPSF